MFTGTLRSRIARAALALTLVACNSQIKGNGGPSVDVPHEDAGRSNGPDFGVGPISDAQAPDGPTCAAETLAAARQPIDLLFLTDISKDMLAPIAGQSSKIIAAKTALLSFVSDPGSEHLGVGLQFFPSGYLDKPCLITTDCGRTVDLMPKDAPPLPSCLKPRQCQTDGQPPGTWLNCAGGLPPGPCSCELADTCKTLIKGMPGTCVELGNCSMTHKDCAEVGKPCAGGPVGDMCQPIVGTCAFPGPSCDPAMYGTLRVPFGDLPDGAQAFLDAFQFTENAPGYSWPLVQAVQGSLAALKVRAAAPGARANAMVLVTSGHPGTQQMTCTPSDPLGAVSELQAAAAATPAIPTYVIGAVTAGDAPALDLVNKLAAAGGGAPTPFLLDGSADVTAAFQAALEKIRSVALPCDFAIPSPKMGALDYTKVNLAVKSGTSTTQPGYVTGAAACDANKGGWFYDADPTKGGKPSRVMLCPSTCAGVKADPAATVDLLFGCATRID